ncbi:MAG: hypothetical protein R6X02_32360 [Enhygromyxa sp.]
MAEAVKYKQPRKFNVVVVALLVALLAGAYALWIYIPVSLRKSEVTRVLDETSSEFTGQVSRMLANDKEREKLLRRMKADIQAVGVEDPKAEYWIEVDDPNQIRFGVLYSDWIELPFTEPREKVVELQMLCTRPGRGSGWTCESQDLQSKEFQADQPTP